jgi:putative hemolysin
MGNDLLYATAVGVCLTLSFLFSGMESGVFALNRLRIRQKMREGDPRARVLMGYLENPENFLWTILVGNTLTNFFAVCMVAAALHAWLGGHAVWFWLAFIGFVFLLYAIGDLLPKMLFQTSPNRLSLALARPFRYVHLALGPLVSLMTWCSQRILGWSGGKAFTGRLFGSREELRLIMQESAQGFTSEERSMINRVLDFQNLTVRQISRPLEKAVTVPAAAPMSRVLELCRQKQITRIPVVQTMNGRSRIMGLVSLKTVLYQTDLDSDKTAGDYVKPALFLDEDLRLEEALRRMQRGGHRAAIVLGRDRQETGVISLQDVLKAIFGDVSL